MGRNTSKIKIQFFDTCWCSRNPKGRSKTTGATQFRRVEDAVAAAEKYSHDRGYTCDYFFCETCCYYHVCPFQAPPGSIPDEDRWTPSKHRAFHARIRKERAEEEAARRAEEVAVIAARC